MALDERRNHARRAEAARLVLNGLRGATGESAVPDLQTWMLPPGAAERILKRLALKGLARATPGGWEPAPPLLALVPLQRLAEGEQTFAMPPDTHKRRTTR